MTGHPTSGRPVEGEPTPTDTTDTGATTTGATSVGATGRRTKGSGVEVDLELASSAERLLEVLQSTLDINAGLAAIRATHRTATGHSTGARPDRGQLAGGAGDADPDVTGEVQAVCLVLAGYLTSLAPAGDDRTGAPPGLGGSVLALGAVHRLLRGLRTGLLHRTLDRPTVDRLLRLIDHNTAEAGQLLREEHRRAARRTRPQIEGWTQIAAGVRDGMVELRPRILALFDDAHLTTTVEPVPRLPV